MSQPVRQKIKRKLMMLAACAPILLMLTLGILALASNSDAKTKAEYERIRAEQAQHFAQQKQAASMDV